MAHAHVIVARHGGANSIHVVSAAHVQHRRDVGGQSPASNRQTGPALCCPTTSAGTGAAAACCTWDACTCSCG